MIGKIALLGLLLVANVYAQECKILEKSYVSCVASKKIRSIDTGACDIKREAFLKCNKTNICNTLVATDCNPYERKFVSCIVKNELKDKSTKICSYSKDALVKCHENKKLLQRCKARKDTSKSLEYYDNIAKNKAIAKALSIQKKADKINAGIKADIKAKELARQRELYKTNADMKAKELARQKELDKIKADIKAKELARQREIEKIKADIRELSRQREIVKPKKQTSRKNLTKTDKDELEKQRELERQRELQRARDEANKDDIERQREEAHKRELEKIRENYSDNDSNNKKILQEIYAAVGISYFDFKKIAGYDISSDPVNFGFSVGANLSLKNMLNLSGRDDSFITPHLSRYSGATHQLDGQDWLEDTIVTVVGVSYEKRFYLTPEQLYMAPFIGIQHKSVTAKAAKPFVNDYEQSGVIIPAGVNTAWYLNHRWNLFGQISFDLAYLFGEKKYNGFKTSSETITGPGLLGGAIYKF